MKHTVNCSLACLLLIAACTPKPGQAQSGSRLSALSWDARTSPFGATFYDKTLGIYCTFEWVSGTEYRCLPLGAERAFFGIEYADDACTAKRAYAYKRCGAAPKPKYVDVYVGTPQDANGCRARQFAAVDANASPATHQKYEGGMCMPSVDTADSQRSWFQPGADVPLSTFVKATATTVPFGSRYTVTKLTAEDGSTVVLLDTLYDTVNDLLCQLSRGSDAGVSSDFVCTPIADYGFFFTTNTCATPVVNHFPPQNPLCAEPKLATPKADRVIVNGPVVSSCASTLKYYVGKPGAVPTPAFSLQDGICTEDTGAPGPSGVYVAATPIDAGSFGKATIEKSGSGRLQEVSLKLEGGDTIVQPGRFYDTTLQTFCRPGYSDGKPRCIPELTNGAGVYFKDATCTQAIVREVDPGLGMSCKKAPTGYAQLLDYFCPTTARAFRIGTTSQALTSVFYRTDKGACAEQMTPGTYYDATELHEGDLAVVEEASPKFF